jgi:hypothetical protein
LILALLKRFTNTGSVEQWLFKSLYYCVHTVQSLNTGSFSSITVDEKTGGRRKLFITSISAVRQVEGAGFITKDTVLRYGSPSPLLYTQ